jgi:hypothetical protein
MNESSLLEFDALDESKATFRKVMGAQKVGS